MGSFGENFYLSRRLERAVIITLAIMTFNENFLMNFFLGGGNDMVRGVRYNNKRDGNEVKLDQNEIFV